MKFIKSLTLFLSFALLSACSPGPSDREIQSIIQSEVEKANKVLSQFNFPLADLFEIKTEVLNKAEQSNDEWLVEVSMKVIANKSLAEANLSESQREQASMIYGNFVKGQELEMFSGKETLILKKGEKGWIARSQ